MVRKKISKLIKLFFTLDQEETMFSDKKTSDVQEKIKIKNIPYLTEENFNHLLHIVYKNGPNKNIDRFSSIIFKFLPKYEITTELRLIHFLSQIGHESGELRYTEELASGRAYEWRRDLGNNRPGDGVRFKGRGLIQLTGRYNYTKFASYIDDSRLITNPILIAQDDDLTVLTAFYYWSRTKLNKYADRDDIRRVTRRINGGYNGLSDRIRLYNLAKSNLNRVKILTIQTLLNDKFKFNLVEDGLYGPNTKNALASKNLNLNNWANTLLG